MKYTNRIESRKSSLALLGASLCGFLSLAAACSGETQPLNSVADGGAGGSAGSGGMGGSGGAMSSGDSGGAGGSGGSTIHSTTAGATVSTGAGGSSGGSDAGRDVLAKKLDLLFVVDNSINMADKQAYFAQAASELVNRLADPNCVDGDDPTLAEGCPEGQQREFAPVADMHIGVISSSLGGHGGDLCSPQSPAQWNPTQNDGGKLMPSVRDRITSYRDQGFLAWGQPDTEYDLESLRAGVVQHIRSAGETGCGYEAPLEAMYRFLIDPSPPQEIVVIDNLAQPTKDSAGNMLVDTQILEQRADFLRPDSALAVVLLSDEDDCSVQDGWIGWLTAASTVNGQTFVMPNATTACEVDANDPCCRSCGLVDETEGCPPLMEDANCDRGRPAGEDSLNLRCFDQKRRFGFDLLYPVDRYVAGLTKTQIEDQWSCSNEECPLVRNPLFPPEDPELDFTRRASEVFVVSVVGVPWQDLATSESLTGDHLTYKSAFDADDWSLIVGSPSEHVAPEDPLMVGSTDPRSGTHPVTGEPVAPETSNDPTENSMNGHEFANVSNHSLQYACTFPLASPRDCSNAGNNACLCTEDHLPENSPLCQPPDGGPADTTQYFEQATPGLRQLELMSKLPNGMPASICPKVVDGDASASSYGYNPAMRALLRKLGSVLE